MSTVRMTRVPPRSFAVLAWAAPFGENVKCLPAEMLKAEAEGCSVLRGAQRRGEGGIRTPDAGITDVTVFETAAFNHSATSPRESVSSRTRPFNHNDRTPQTLFATLYLYVRFVWNNSPI
jgi:hypothetical protein